MKKYFGVLVEIKALAAMIFTGLILAYMVAGWLYSTVSNVPFEYSIPFIFVLQGVILAIAISVLWYVLLSNCVIKKMRFYMRFIIFVVALVIILSACFATFFAFHTNWAKLWLLISGLFIIAITGISIIGEFYFKATGKHYTDHLEEYKKRIRETGKS